MTKSRRCGNLWRPAAAFSMVAVSAMLFMGCPQQLSQDVVDAVQLLASVQDNLDLVSEITQDQIDAAITTQAQEKQITGTQTIDQTVDLDSTDGLGNDIAPNATGQFQVTGTLEFSAGGGTGILISSDDLAVTFLTDIVATDPATGAESTLSQGDSLTFGLDGSYTLTTTIPITLTTATNLTTQLPSGFTVTTKDEDGTTRTVTWALDLEIDSQTDATLADILLGTATPTVAADLTTGVTWTEGETTHSVEMAIVLDQSTDPVTQSITVVYNSQTFGPYTFSEFQETFGTAVTILGM